MKRLLKRILIGLSIVFALSESVFAYTFNFAVTNNSGSSTDMTGTINFSTFTAGAGGSFNPTGGPAGTVSNVVYGGTSVAGTFSLIGFDAANAYAYQASSGKYYVTAVNFIFSSGGTYYQLYGTGATSTSASFDIRNCGASSTCASYSTDYNNEKVTNPAGSQLVTAADLTGTGAPEIDGKLIPQALLLLGGVALMSRRSRKAKPVVSQLVA